MKNYLEKLYANKTLSKAEAKQALVDISSGNANNSQIASFMTVYLMRSINVDELKGFKEALLELCLPIQLDGETIDLCGTGGDSKNTFNISTLSSFVVAASGVKVAKHGNYGVSSISGSSNVLEYFGYKFSDNQSQLQKQLDETNICFMHAPLFHPALKRVAPIRQEMGVKTFFNMLGPLVNPAKPKHRLVGVFNLELARIYHYLLQAEQSSYCVVHSLDGYDEISTTSSFKLFSQRGEELKEPEEHTITRCVENDLFGGNTVKEAASIFKKILEGNGTVHQNNVVAINAGYAIQCATTKNINECIAIARENLLNKNTLTVFTKLINLN